MQKYVSTCLIFLKFSVGIHFYKMNICVKFDEKGLSFRKVIAFYRKNYSTQMSLAS